LFLLEQAENYIADNPFKALKRTLSLCGMLGMTEEYHVMLELLNHPTVVREVARSSLDEFEKQADMVNGSARDRLLRVLEAERKNFDSEIVDRDDVDFIKAEVSRYVRNTTGRINRLLELAGN
jgi:hypothetical protein